MNLLVNFARAIDPGVKKVFDGSFKQVPKASDKICKVETADDFNQEIASNVGVGMARLRNENASVNYEDFLQGITNTLTQYTYDKGVKISKALMNWQKMGQIKGMVTTAAQAIARRKEFDITKLLERGFLTTYTHSVDGSAKVDLSGGDSVALFTPSHATVRSSAAQSNRIGDGTTVNMDIAEDAFEAAEGVIAPAITDDSDQVISMKLDRVFVSPKKHWGVQRLLKSDGRVGTPNNDINLVKGRYELVRLDFMDVAYADYWFMQDSVMNSNIGFMTLLTGSTGEYEHDGPYVDFDTKAIKHSWETEFAAGHNMYQSMLGSKGTNAA